MLPVTSKQDFFGISIMEAVSCGCHPLLPDRLSYPELVPKEYHDDMLYSGLEEFESKLEWILTNPPRLTRQQIKEIAVPYFWKNMIEKYDELFQLLMDRTVKFN